MIEWTQRDELAKHAMLAIIAKHPAEVVYIEGSDSFYEALARGAYAYADAMLAVREGGK